jgi:putative hemolysin
LQNALTNLRIDVNVAPADLERIPRQGATIVVANHPFGLLEGLVLGTVLPRVRPDVKILANSMLKGFDRLQDLFIFVDVFGGSNLQALREAIDWLKNGGLLVIFPAGEVAHLDVAARRVTDPEWNTSVARLARRSSATVVPAYFAGSNSAFFQAAGLVHPRLRTALLVRELLNKRGSMIDLRVGQPIEPQRVHVTRDDRQLTAYLRHRTYLLEHRGRSPKRREYDGAPVIPAQSRQSMALETAALDPLVEANEYRVYLAEAVQIPSILQEIGRLREITFRDVGEGTGESSDLDEFDQHYQHLFVWNRERQEVVGSYRLAATDLTLSARGIAGLYTSTLFAYKRRFLEALGPAAELGRSFVRPEYQKNYAALLLLWKGIGAWVAKNPRCKVLFGPVSISNDYKPVSRQLMATFFQQLRRSHGLADLVKARSPFRTRAVEGSGMVAWDIEDLSALISDIESDRKGLPVLLRQYLKLGGELLCFNLDARFSNSLDGLIVVDLTRTDARVLERYLGREGARTFHQYHARSEKIGC